MWWSSHLRFAAFIAIAVMLSACGFALRGSYTMPYASVYLNAANNTPLVAELKHQLSASTQLAPNATGAAAKLNIIADRRDKQILSLSGAGRVREYELKLLVSYQVVDAAGTVVIPTTEILLSRIMSFDDSLIIAKQQEEAQLYKDMETDVVSQILRRMVAIKAK